MLNITDFGAVGDGITMNTRAIADAIRAAAEARESLCVPDGVFLSGTIDLCGVSLYLEPKAVLKASANLNDYPPQAYVHNEMGVLRAFLVCMNAEHVSITGNGTIDLSGRAFYDTSVMNIPQTRVPMTDAQIAECTYPIGERPGQGLFFYNCHDLLLRGIHVIDSPNWTISICECEQVILSGLNINTDLNIPNDDGIHLSSSKGVIISDCHISSGDDCIAMSAITNWTKPCEDIVVTNCILHSCSKAIVLGYIYSKVRNVNISNCIIKESNRGLTFMCHDECGMIENVNVTNCIIETKIRAGNWWGNGEPILMMAVPHDRHLPQAQRMSSSKGVAIRNVRISHVYCNGENAMGFIGTDGNIRRVKLEDVTYRRVPSANLPLKGYTFDLSPAEKNVDVPGDCGLFIREADVQLEDVFLGSATRIELEGTI